MIAKHLKVAMLFIKLVNAITQAFTYIVPLKFEVVILAVSLSELLIWVTPGAPNENIVQNHLNIALLDVF